MKIRAIGAEGDLKALIDVIKGAFDVSNVSDMREADDDKRFKIVYIDVVTEDNRVTSTLSEYQIIEYCNKFRSKADVMHNFNVAFDAAAEILDRLAESGALFRIVWDKKYVYIDARFLPFVKKKCGNCEHRGTMGDCYKGVVPDDICYLKRGSDSDDTRVYIPVNHAPCEKYDYSLMAVFEAATTDNYRRITEGD